MSGFGRGEELSGLVDGIYLSPVTVKKGDGCQGYVGLGGVLVKVVLMYCV